MIENNNNKFDDFIKRAKGKSPFEIIGLFSSERENLLSNSTKEEEERIINMLLADMSEKDKERASKFLELLKINRE